MVTDLKIFKSVNSFDTRYLNQLYSPIANLLIKPLNLNVCNDTWFDKPPRTRELLFDYKHQTLDFPKHVRTVFIPLSDLHSEISIPSPPSIEIFDTNICSHYHQQSYQNYCMYVMVYFLLDIPMNIFSSRYGILFRLIEKILLYWI